MSRDYIVLQSRAIETDSQPKHYWREAIIRGIGYALAIGGTISILADCRARCSLEETRAQIRTRQIQQAQVQGNYQKARELAEQNIKQISPLKREESKSLISFVDNRKLDETIEYSQKVLEEIPEL